MIFQRSTGAGLVCAVVKSHSVLVPDWSPVGSHWMCLTSCLRDQALCDCAHREGTEIPVDIFPPGLAVLRADPSLLCLPVVPPHQK